MEPIEDTNGAPFVLPEKWYNRLKWLVMIVLPAFTTFYIGLDAVIGVPAEEKVAGVSALVATLIGTIVGISSKQYNNSEQRFFGELHVEDTDEGTLINRQVFNDRPEISLADKDEVTFKVVRQ